LLTSARLYIDQVGQHVTECLPLRSDAKTVVQNLFATEYDAHFEYKFMEALRNYVQHRGLPVQWASSGSRWTDDPRSAEAMLEYSIELGAGRALFAEDEKFKKTVLADMPEKIDLKAAARRYVECLSRVHASIRTLIEEVMERSRLLLEEAHGRYGDVFKESLVGLAACQCDDAGLRLETIPLLLDWDDVRKELQKRNRKLINLGKRFVSSRINRA
jgi:hypothetical protein